MIRRGVRRRGRTVAPALVALAILAGGATGQAGVHTDARGDLRMALTGDAIITRSLRPYAEPEYLEMLDLLRGADVAFTNLEVLFHDYEPFPAHQSGGTWMRAEPALATDLAWAGIDMVSRANNHTGDYGVEGLRLTTRHVEAAGLIHAGAGESLAEAREARFVETARGRVALVSTASTFPAHSAAGRSRGEIPARPGLSPLRYSSTRVVAPEHLRSLVAVLDEAGLPYSGGAERLRAFSTDFVAGPEPGVRTLADPRDVEAIAAVVSNASRQADHVIVSIHAHESRGTRSVPADFVVEFAHAMIDAGATVFVGHGPHVLRGIEIYRGRPIFYSLGDFIFQNETLLRLPEENYERYGLGPDHHVADFNDRRYRNDTSGFPANPEIWEAVIAVPRWEAGALAEVALHPITLGHGEARWVRGRPMLAHGALGARILGYLAERSRAFGTEIDVRDGVGYVRLR